MTLLALLEHLPQLASRDRASDLLLYNHHEVSFCSLSREASASNIQYRQPLVPSAFQEADCLLKSMPTQLKWWLEESRPASPRPGLIT
ncbi:Ubiquitin carboxyl-terminal hydrolase MIY1 [Fusarium oxysporum f. sp. albedinis]|nr:Ubiquitin carboxyl-terminal hydrolase MIY1 [Fusarium oxysporum f. sp. albedinis]